MHRSYGLCSFGPQLLALGVGGEGRSLRRRVRQAVAGWDYKAKTLPVGRREPPRGFEVARKCKKKKQRGRGALATDGAIQTCGSGFSFRWKRVFRLWTQIHCQDHCVSARFSPSLAQWLNLPGSQMKELTGADSEIPPRYGCRAILTLFQV